MNAFKKLEIIGRHQRYPYHSRLSKNKSPNGFFALSITFYKKKSLSDRLNGSAEEAESLKVQN